MTGITGHNIGFRNSALDKWFFPSPRDPCRHTGGFRNWRSEINYYVTRLVGTQSRHSTSHILFRKRIVSRVLAKTSAPKCTLSIAHIHRGSRRRSIETCEIHAPGDSITNDWWLPFVRTVNKAVIVSPSTFASIRPLAFCPETLPP
jgi:hypothetical protein